MYISRIIYLVVAILAVCSTVSSQATYTITQVNDVLTFEFNSNPNLNTRIYDSVGTDITPNCTAGNTPNIKLCKIGNIPSGTFRVSDGMTSTNTSVTLAPYIVSIPSNLPSYADSDPLGFNINGMFFEPNYSYNITYKSNFTLVTSTVEPSTNTSFTIIDGFIGIGSALNVTITKFNATSQVTSSIYTTNVGAPVMTSYYFDTTQFNHSMAVYYFTNLCAPLQCGNEKIQIKFEGGVYQNVSYSRPTVSWPVDENWTFGPFVIKVGDQESEPNYFAPLFTNSEIISDISPKPPLSGGNITVTGRFMKETDTLGVQPWSFSLKDGTSLDVPHRFLTNEYPYKVELEIPAGSGVFGISYTYNVPQYISGESNVFSVNYTSPSITKVSSLNYNEAGTVYIDGNNFADSGLGVTIGKSVCKMPTTVVQYIKISCQFDAKELPATNGGSLPVVVEVNGLVSQAGQFKYEGVVPTDSSSDDVVSHAPSQTTIHVSVLVLLFVFTLCSILL